MMKHLSDINIKEKWVFIRNDFNVPLNAKKEILDDTRIQSAVPTLDYLIKNQARIVCASHLGRPKGEKDPEFSLKPVADRLAELLKKPVIFSPETIGQNVEKMKANLKPGEVLLLENLRFHPGETENDRGFARELAKGIDVYINNAFGCSHRSHASVVAIVGLVPVSVPGLLMKKEVDYLNLALEKPSEKYVLILGGAKVSDKIPVIQNLLGKASTILIGGAMAYTFLKAKGEKVGQSRVENDYLKICLDILAKAETRGVKIQLPVDHIAAVKVEPNVTIRMVEKGREIPDEMMGLDIGIETVENFRKAIRNATLVVWNGPMGVFEIDDFSAGTMAIAQAIANSSATSIVGGGDSVAAVHKAGVSSRISHLSTGGGASLEYLSGKTLPGIAALS